MKIRVQWPRILAGAAVILYAQLALAQAQYPFLNPDTPLEQRVSNILSLMTLDEKIACLQTSTAVPRLNIPDAGNSEGLHGLVQGGNWEAASLLKHFFANSNETTRGGSSSNFDNALFWDYYSVPFRMAIEDGGAKSFMASYNAWNHVPMTVNPVIQDVVIKQWGADGIFSSDATAVEQLASNQKYYPDQQTALAAAIKAGVGQILTFVPDLKSRYNRLSRPTC